MLREVLNSEPETCTLSSTHRLKSSSQELLTNFHFHFQNLSSVRIVRIYLLYLPIVLAEYFDEAPVTVLLTGNSSIF